MMGLSAGQVYISERGGSYNSFMRQVGFCKAQSFDTQSRSTSVSPPLFQSGRVWMGVGLSHVQFQKSIVSCGRCIEVLSVDRFYQLNKELTGWNYGMPHGGNFTVMVFDECTDAICESGFLDFDIYSEKQPVAYGNPTNLTWQFVPCPVGKNDMIGFLFCMGYKSCHETSQEGKHMKDLYHEAVKENWFSIYPRNFRTAITSVMIQGEPLHDIQAWVWKSPHKKLLEDKKWSIEWTDEEGAHYSWVLDWAHYFHETSTHGYRGGYIIQTNRQN